MAETLKISSTRVRTLIWLFFIGGSGTVPFASLYYKRLFANGNGDSAIGIITLLLTLQPLFSIFSNPFAGYLADRFKIENRMLVVCALATALGASLIGLPGLLPALYLSSYQKIILIALGIIILGLFSGPIFPIINAETFELISRYRLPEGSYGLYRIHGSLSWIVFTSLIGISLALTDFLPLIYIFYTISFVILALVALTGVKQKVKPVKLPLSYLKKDWRFRRFIIFNFIYSFSLYGSLFFTGYLLNDEHINFLFIGLAFAISALLEIPIMLFTPGITLKWGNRFLVLSGTLIMTLKLLCLGLAALKNWSWLIFPIMLIHGLGFSLQFMGSMNIINNLAHPSLRATYLNLYSTLGVNIPWALGVIFFGWIIGLCGSTVMMLIASAFCVLSLIYFIIFMPPSVLRHTNTDQTPAGLI